MNETQDVIDALYSFLENDGKDAYEFLLEIWHEWILPLDWIKIIDELSDHPLSLEIRELYENKYNLNPFFGMV